MNTLFTPWRLKYIESKKTQNCIFCAMASETKDQENAILFRAKHCFVVLNHYPYINGHLMVVPYQHASHVSELSLEAITNIGQIVQKCERILMDAYHPDGCNIGMNLGAAAGAGVAHHLHVHMLPRWAGDTNFMTTVGDVRVIPEEIPHTFDRLSPYFIKK